MFGPIEIPFGCKMMFNTLKMKPGATLDQIEEALAEMCSVVKETYGNAAGGFIAGQVFKFSGFVSPEGSLGSVDGTDDHVAIATYWKTFDQHETSHKDALFNEKFSALKSLCTNSQELGYEMLWQGAV